MRVAETVPVSAQELPAVVMDEVDDEPKRMRR
jgi:hypothetical protein